MAEFGQITHENLSSRVYREIREAMINGQYEPGERIVIAALATKLGTSITPVREAIFRLVSEQALELKAATSVHVRMPSVRQLEEIQLIRILLEGAATERAAERITDRQLADLDAIQAEFIEAAGHDPKRASIHNRRFHFALMEFSELETVASIVENLWVIMGPLLKVFHQTVPGRQLGPDSHRHFDVLAALRARDPARARAAMVDDIRWGKVLIDWLDSQSGGTRLSRRELVVS